MVRQRPRFMSLEGFGVARITTPYNAEMRRDTGGTRTITSRDTASTTTTSSRPSWSATLALVALAFTGPAVITGDANIQRLLTGDAVTATSAGSIESVEYSVQRFEWRDYLDRLQSSDTVARAVARATADFWRVAVAHVPSLRVPAAGPTPDGGMQVVWRHAGATLVADIYPDERYWVLMTGDAGSAEGDLDLDTSPELVNALRKFAVS